MITSWSPCPGGWRGLGSWPPSLATLSGGSRYDDRRSFVTAARRCLCRSGERRPQTLLFLAGSGRSGTTWLSEIINHRRGYRYVFEPFNPREVGPFEHFNTKQYLRPDDQREEFLEPARLALTGGLRDPWTDRFNGRIVARRRLIKDIRANLLLGWIRANFPGMPIILLLRHP